MTPPSTERALAASQAWLLEQDAPEAAIVAHEAGVAGSDADARRWIARILGDQDASGSWGGDLLRTAEALLTVKELRSAAGVVEQDPGVGRAHDWIRGRRGLPGTWAEGCSPARHEQGLCHHFIGGFFSPGPPDVPCGEARLRCGARLAGDSEIRLTASIAALRCVLGDGRSGRDDRLHLSALRRLVRVWEGGPPEGLSTGSLLSAILALVESHDPQDREAAEWGLRLVGGKQRGDGSWVETDAFQALDVIGTAAKAEIAADRMRRAHWHGARLLISSQQNDGSWGPGHGARRALIAWRTLRRVVPETAA
jgi:hypothetical protein